MLEKLLELLATLVVAVNANTEALKGAPAITAKGSKAKETPAKEEKKVEAPVYPTAEDIVAACQPILDIGQGAHLKKLAEKHGLAKLRESAGTEKAIAVLGDIKALADTLKKEPADSGV